MRICIFGGRDFTHLQYLYAVMDNCIENLSFEVERDGETIIFDKEIIIICGGAKGADALGEEYAKRRGYKMEFYPAEWKRYGRGAGFRRNDTMAKISDLAIGFWDGKSKGTDNMRKTCAKHGTECIINSYSTLSLHVYMKTVQRVMKPKIEDEIFCIPDEWKDHFYNEHVEGYIKNELIKYKNRKVH